VSIDRRAPRRVRPVTGLHRREGNFNTMLPAGPRAA